MQSRWIVFAATLSLALLKPASPQTPPAESSAGLVATYSDSLHRVRMIVPTPNLGLDAGESAHPSLEPEFEAEWVGLLQVLETGEYRFEWPGELTVDGAPAAGQRLRLQPGRHPIGLRFRRTAGAARLQLRWESNRFPLEPVPSSSLLHDPQTAPSAAETAVERGRTLVEDFGCVNCHAAAGLERRRAPHLTGIGGRVDRRWLYAWLRDPFRRLDARMPALMDESEAGDVAAYLSGLGTIAPARGRRPTGADIERGRALYGSIGCAACHSDGALGVRGLGSKMTSLEALAGYLKDPTTVDASGRMPALLNDDDEARRIAAFLLESRDPEFELAAPSGNPERGRALAGTLGCAACHTIEGIPAPAAATPLDRLDPERGCLGSPPPARLPRYRLSPEERGAIAAFLASYRQHPDRRPAPVYTFRRDLERLRCTACHQVDHIRPTGAPAETAPVLSDTGGKLRSVWLGEVLSGRARAFGYLELRMPRYTSGAVGHLVAGFAKSFGVEPGEGPHAPAVPGPERTRGVDRIGMNIKKGGMACIGCHDWGDFKSQGEDGPQLLGVAQRLRYDWFQRWMLDPTRILSGTSMPNYFRSTAREDATRVIRSLWGALALGTDMPLPEGLRRVGGVLGSEEKPVPDREALVIRWDMPEATPAAIAVGMPGRVSYCFDAGESRLRYAWLGGFVDMSGTLHRKVDETRLTPTAKVLGEIFYHADEAPLRPGSPETQPAARFRGYRLRDGYPEFHYTLDGLDIWERIIPAAGNRGIVRQFTIARLDRPLWFTAAPAPGVAIRTSLGAISNGRIAVPPGTPARFEVTILKEDSR